ncbi:hypothetical protein [Bathymodiolus japonicus methanotrophic gill symbiont]|uniref:hypothetical protein n=1 Tax=Bathymodiolus japonicus methanotrophic gill symbiont TaxID=113269 RepID=UPI001C8EBEFF|nr:hypothetical protein [Bathymodiolus japonicus methanotrophic gill symbiont]
MGDALNALRPQRLRTKAASSLLPHWLDGYSGSRYFCESLFWASQPKQAAKT